MSTTATEATISEASAEWYDWRERLSTARCGDMTLDWMVGLEQVMLRSQKETRCAECGEAGTIVHTSGLIKSVDHYYHCDGCDAHFEGGVGCMAYTVLGQAGRFEAIVESVNNKRTAERIARDFPAEARVRANR